MSVTKYRREQELRAQHLCIICAEPAEPRGDKGFWSKCSLCREREERQRRKERKEKRTWSLCWECKNAVPDAYGQRGCSWSRHRLPVDGWEAKETSLKIMQEVRIKSYVVRKCPKFEKG